MEKQFAEWVGLVEPVVDHLHLWTDTLQFEQVFNYFDVPEFWREPVRLVAMGASYYSADKWYTEYVPQ